jgi:two-component system OmpR family sensor kinase
MKTLYGKLAAVLLGLLVFIGTIGVAFALSTQRRYEAEVNQRLNRDLAANLVAGDVLLVNGKVNEDALEHVFHSLMVVNPSIEVYLLDLEGGIVAYSAPTGRVKRSRVAVAPIKAFLAGNPLPILGEDPRSLDRRKVFSVSPIMVDDRYEGYLYVVLASEEHDSIAQVLRSSQIMRLGIAFLGGSLLVALVAGLGLFSLITRRLRRLSHGVETFRRSDFTEPAATGPALVDHGNDEIGSLSRAFTRMQERILQQIQRLKQTDELRRELIANVSHDLRTPLASMRGYLETLFLKGDSLSSEQRQRYLTIATGSSERLGKLVEELFELARLESTEMQIDVEPFAIAELVHDLVQEFQLRAADKGVTLEARHTEGTPLVSADIGLIQRALRNLIENAISHTDDGGSVTIMVEPEGAAVAVRVADTGRGIPPDKLERVFERFYQAHENDGGEPRRPGGLGLAIVKKILELHGSAVLAASTVGKGTAFWFSLPMATSGSLR